MPRLLMLVWVLSFFGAALADESRPIIKVAVIEFPTFAELNAEGELVGKTVTLSRKLIVEAGYEPQFQLLPTARIWLGLQNGDVDIWPGIMNKPDMTEHTLLTERDMGYVSIYLYHRPDTPTPVWPDGLRGKDVIVITNFTYTQNMRQLLQQTVGNLYQSASHAGAVEMLMRGRGDYLLDYRSQVEPVLQQRGIASLPHIEITAQPMRFMISRRSPLAFQLREDLDAAFDRLQARGEELDVSLQ